MAGFSPQRHTRRLLRLAIFILFIPHGASAASLSPLYSRGYTVIPEPQKVVLGTEDFRFGEGWRLVLGKGVHPTDVAVESLREDLQARFRVTLDEQVRGGGRAKTVNLEIIPNSVGVGEAADRDKELLAEEAYRMDLEPERVRITANAAAGLFYGVETLVQLVKREEGGLWLPEGQIVDWPDLQLRVIFWDDSTHLDRPDEIRRAIRLGASFKVNGFAIRLDGHFQFKSAPAVVEPYALSPQEFQELTNYGLRYHVQVIPYLDGPAHDTFILKHPEYAALREYPQSNYEFCVTNPDTYKLFFGMYDDLLAANKGGKYFLVSTDEPYYVGLAKNSACNEVDRATELGSVGKLLAEFVTKTSNYLHDRGRSVIFWGEYPLKAADISSLPSHLINGEVYGPDFDPVFKARGIRQMIYTPTQGGEWVFPNYYMLPPSERLHPGTEWTPRMQSVFEHVSFNTARKQADLMGVFVAAWSDMGLHPETFWLGLTAGSALGWNPGTPDPRESMNAFYKLYYGPSAVSMGRIYQLMSFQAQAWGDLWEWAPSTSRKPIFGNSDFIYNPPKPAKEQTLPLPPLPSLSYLTVERGWEQINSKRLQLARKFMVENDELLDLLYANLDRVEFNRYNLEVFISMAQLYRQNLQMILNLEGINSDLESASQAASQVQASEAVASMDRALDLAENTRAQRNLALREATRIWYKTWFPRVVEANGRRYLYELADLNGHVPDLTIDMSYLVYRELELPIGEWVERLRAVRNQYAQAHSLPTRDEVFDWKDTSSVSLREQVADQE